VGIGIITLGLASLEIVLDEGQRKDWFSSNLILFFAIVAVVTLVTTVFVEWRKKDPIVDLKLLKDRTFAAATFMMFVLGFVLYGSMALLPIFLQTLLGYTASLSGWILSPGGVAVLIMMPIVAMLMKHFDTRLLIGTGFIICGTGLYMMAGFNLQVDFQTAMIARMVQSLGLAFLFIPMNVTAFQNILPAKTSYATGLLNLVRNIGGSTGIALVTTILSRRSQFHQANLIGNLREGNPAYSAMLSGARNLLVTKGDSLADAAHKAVGLAYGTMLRQSTMMAFADTFWIMGTLCFCLLPIIFLMKKTRVTRGSSAPPAH
jgi:DHA2 family multidrug resistance protein